MVGDTSAILLQCIGEHQRSFGDTSPRGISGNVCVCGGGGGGGGVDLYKFLSWFMSVIILYYFTCMFLSRVYVHFYCFYSLYSVLNSMGYYTMNNFYYCNYHYYY